MRLPFLRSLLLASLCVTGLDAAAQPTAGSGSGMLRIGIRIERNCEIGTAVGAQPGALPTIACNRPLAYQVSIDGAPAPSAGTALALRLSTPGAAPRDPARYATVAF